MIPKHIIEEIRNKADVVKVVSDYVQIRKRGKNYLGLCPFHSEKDPSFTVSPEKQLWHCFGCNEGGNAFAFIMKMENIGFVEAVEELGTKFGVNVPRATASKTSRSEKETLYQVMQIAAKFFREQLSAEAKKYLAERKISDKTVQQFGLGFAPPGWDNLFKHLIARGVNPNLVEKTGLILARQGQDGYYDRFRNRLIFPITDQRGRMLAFGGRSVGDEEPKYLNSADTAIYHKGETLFGLNHSKDSIKKSKTAIMVEGYFDLITPFQAGIENIVATLGTALTTQQCKLLARYCDTVILGFDADAAGGVAAERSIELLRVQGLKVKVAKLSGGKDPDDIIRHRGKDGFDKCLTSALPYLEFKIRRALARHNLKEIESRAKALREVAKILSEEKDEFVQKEYAKLAAPLIDSDIDALLTETRRMRHYQKGAKNTLRRKTEKPSSKIEEAEKSLIAIAAQNLEALKLLKEETKVEEFSLIHTRKAAEILLNADLGGESPAHFLLENMDDEESKKFLSRLLMSEHLSSGDKSLEIMRDCLLVIKDQEQKNRIAALKQEIKAAEQAGKTQKVAELLSTLKSEIGQVSIR
jgi:DNA primase